jgi:hypothetical protein
LFWIAAFSNLTADNADDTDLIPKRILIVGQAHRLPFILERQPARLPYNDLRLSASSAVIQNR